MPSPGAYRKAFGLLAGKRLCGAVVDEVRCGHTTVARFRKYDFPWSAKLTLPTGLEAAAFERALRKFADDTEDTVVYSSYGSPYACSDWGTIEKFAAIINRAGYASPIRTPRGRDILAACGQLKSESEKVRASDRRRAEQA